MTSSTGRLTMLLATGALIFNLSACSSTEKVATTESTSASPGSTTSPSTTAPAPAPAKLNLNSATDAELLAGIPNLGDLMLGEFREYGPYVSILQFRGEIGKYVDEAQLAEYEKYVYVPIAINDADSATLQQIPGLDATEADALIAGRPYASTAAFVENLTVYVSATELVIAQAYLSE